LKHAGAAAGSAILGAPALALAQNQPIRIGISNALSGPNALYGEPNVMGQKIAVDQCNKAGGLLGRQVELVIRDDRAQTAQGVAIARELSGAGVNFIMGGGSSAVALAYCSLVPELKMIYVSNAAAAMGITHEAYNPNVFRLCSNAYSLYSSIGKAVAEKHPQVMKWAAITPDYSFGHDAARVFTNAVRQFHPKRDSKDFDIRKTVVVGATQTDFRPQINALMNSDVQGLFIGMPGAPEISFFQQARAVGLDRKLKVMAEVSGDVAFQAMGKDLPENVWGNVFWPYEMEPVKSNKFSQALMRDYAALTGKTSPTGHLFRGYHAMQGLLEGIRKAKSIEVPAVIAAMEDFTFESALGPYKVRTQDHAGMGTLYVGTYTTQDAAPFIRLKEARTISEQSVLETPSPGREYVM
jgi:branched-chain amino acid transport system substrate-binding protein